MCWWRIASRANTSDRGDGSTTAVDADNEEELEDKNDGDKGMDIDMPLPSDTVLG